MPTAPDVQNKTAHNSTWADYFDPTGCLDGGRYNPFLPSSRHRSVQVEVFMHDSFDGAPSTGSSPVHTRRTALERLVLGTGAFFGLGMSAQAGDDSRRPMIQARPRRPRFDPPPALVDLTKEQMQSAWDDLGDPTKAETAIRLLATGKQAVSLLAEYMKPAIAPPSSGRIDQLIEDLQSTRFATRQAAVTELEKIGLATEPALRKALTNQPPLELSRRIEAILAKLLTMQTQFRNGLQVLELLAAPDALLLLATLSKGHAASWQTSEAMATCDMVRTACWYLRVYGPAQAAEEFQEEIFKQYYKDLEKRPPNTRYAPGSR